jgi:dihydroxy-acid dehydratase
VEEGDIIAIDIPSHKLELKVEDSVLSKRRESFKPKLKPVPPGSYLERYRKMVRSASTGAIFGL